MHQLLALAVLLCLPAAHAFDHDHARWDKFLKAHVTVAPDGNSSKVNYSAAQANRADLDAYLAEIERVDKKEYDGWTDAQKQAFLINAYNALTVKWIIDNKIPASIKDTGSFLKSPWKKKFFKIFGEESHLDHLEHDLARGKFNNCRLHFAFNCASIGCPMLRNEAWRAERLKVQFEDAAKRFLADSSRNSYDAKSNSLQLSKIFDWYGKDFERDKSCVSVKEFVRRRINDGGKPIPDNVKIKFLEYDWKLNGA